MMNLKKYLSQVMAGVLSLSMAASLAFVVGPTADEAAKSDAFQVKNFFVTDAMATAQGTRVWSNLVDNSQKSFAVNELVYYTMEINIANPAKNSKVTSAVGNEYKIIVSSPTSDLSLSTQTDVVLTHPFNASYADVVSTDNGTVKAGATQAVTYEKGDNSMTFTIKVWDDDPYNSNINKGYEAINLAIREGENQAASTTFHIGFAGLNRDAKTGSATAKVAPTEFKFKGDSLTVNLNGREYTIKKVPATWPATSNTAAWPTDVAASLSTIGYQISTRVNGSHVEIVTLDTEVTNAEGYGLSLGLVKGGVTVSKSTFGGQYVFTTTGAPAFNTEESARLETMMNDFGFSTNANYKLQDKNFEQATTYKATLTATYNPAPVDDGEVDEGTDETPDDEIDDDIIEEEIPEVEEEEVPQTGDKSADIALALTLGALLSAAALAIVMRKASAEESK